MRMRKKAPVLQSIPSTRRTSVPASPSRRPQAPAAPRAGAIRPGRRYGVHSGKSRLQPAPDQGSRQADLSAPLIPLTLRAMPRTSPRARNSALPAVLLLSVLAVLASACSPAPALAEEASGPQYETEVPTVPQEQGSGGGGHHNGSTGGGSGGSPAEISNSPGQGGGGKNPGAAGGSHKGQGNQGPESGGSNPGGGSEGAPQGKAGLGENRQLKPGENASSTESESSSPLVPILIAIAVLAAISIGAFYYRQRRQGAGSSVSPKAS